MVLKEIIGETNTYDKKEKLETKEPKSWLKSVSAFANGSGGKLYFGIDDNDNVIGLNTYKEDSEKISEIIKEHMDPIPDFSLSFETITNNRKVIVLDVSEGKETPYYFKDKNNQVAYKRVGNQSIPCDHKTMISLVLKGISKSYDSLVSEYLVKDYEFNDLIKAFKEEKGIDITLNDLESLDLARGEYLTYAGVLLADKCPLRHSRIFCTRWNGLDKGCDALDSLDIEHLSLIELLHKGIEFIDRHNNKGWIKLNFGRKEYVSYPGRAVFEGLCNSLLHRDYLEIGSEVHIDIFDDRIEISSPGGMFEGGNIQDKDVLTVKSVRRNPIISDIFGRLDYIERRGSGFKKIIYDYKAHSDYVLPSFDSDNNFFTLILKNIQYYDLKAGAHAVAHAVAQTGYGIEYNAVRTKDILNNKISSDEFFVYCDKDLNNSKYDYLILTFCLSPKSRQEIQESINYKSKSHMSKILIV